MNIRGVECTRTVSALQEKNHGKQAGRGGRRQTKGGPHGSGLAVGNSESLKVSEHRSDTAGRSFIILMEPDKAQRRVTEMIKGLGTGLWRETTE